MKLITCEFSMDSGCVKLRFDDGTEMDIDCTLVESEYQSSSSKPYKAYVCIWVSKNGSGDTRYMWVTE